MQTVTLTTTAATLVVTVDVDATAAVRTAAIQSALDAAAAAGGGVVTLSAGTWDIVGTGKAADGCLQIGSNTTLEGGGTGVTTLRLADGAKGVTGIVRTDSGATRPDGSFTVVEHVTLRDLTIDGNRANTSGSTDGFYCGPKPNTAQADRYITLDRVEVMGCSRYGIDPHERTTNLLFRDCMAHSNTVDGFTIDFCTDVRFERCSAWGNGRHGFNLVTGTSGVELVDCRATENGGSGLIVQTGDNEVRAFSRDVIVDGGEFENNGRAGIEAKQMTGLVIENAVIAGNIGWGVLLAGVVGARIDNTALDGNGGPAPVRVLGMTQTFADADPLNDRWIASGDVTRDGIAVAAPENVNGAGLPIWTLFVTDEADHLDGSLGADTIAAGSGADTVLGLAGNDLLYGEDGADTLDGGAGADTLIGGAGHDRLLVWSQGSLDRLDGGAGRDMADFLRIGTSVTVDLSAPTVVAWAGGVMVAELVSIENVRGGLQSDRLTGSAGANALYGAFGADTIDGGDGADILAGGRGDDLLTGGSGADRFRFYGRDGHDVITDFQIGVDRLEFRGFTEGDITVASDATGALVTFADSSILLTGIDAGLLTPADFRYF